MIQRRFRLDLIEKNDRWTVEDRSVPSRSMNRPSPRDDETTVGHLSVPNSKDQAEELKELVGDTGSIPMDWTSVDILLDPWMTLVDCDSQALLVVAVVVVEGRDGQIDKDDDTSGERIALVVEEQPVEERRRDEGEEVRGMLTARGT